jgi:hypothetical protein
MQSAVHTHLCFCVVETCDVFLLSVSIVLMFLHLPEPTAVEDDMLWLK